MDQFEACVEKSLMENIAALAPPQDEVSELWLSPDHRTDWPHSRRRHLRCKMVSAYPKGGTKGEQAAVSQPAGALYYLSGKTVHIFRCLRP